MTWQGQIAGVDAALDAFKADKAYPMRKLHEVNFDYQVLKAFTEIILQSILSYKPEIFP